jgi:hypothetical protein
VEKSQDDHPEADQKAVETTREAIKKTREIAPILIVKQGACSSWMNVISCGAILAAIVKSILKG